jgi:thiosulfate reductase cytochrome b subunit
MKEVYLYTRFERFWHWMQAVLVILLIASGFEIHGTWRIWGFQAAHNIHYWSAWGLVVLTVFAAFWHFTTGEWRQYVPTTTLLKEVFSYYTSGIFRGLPHPFKKERDKKLNPLQRLTYLILKLVLFPLQFITGFLYMYYPEWPRLNIHWTLKPVALLHTLGGFAFLAFLILHVYLTTTGPTVFSHLKAMITGWEKIE